MTIWSHNLKHEAYAIDNWKDNNQTEFVLIPFDSAGRMKMCMRVFFVASLNNYSNYIICNQ
jgi:hypothetical protein